MPIRSVNRTSDWAANPLFAPFVSLLFPQKCGLCEGPVSTPGSGTVCEECWSKTNFFDRSSPLCEKCGAFNSHRGSTTAMRCARCDEHSFDLAFALGPYENALRATILALKSNPHLPHIAVKLMTARFESIAKIDFNTIMPVPLSKQRRFERGFNQAEIIADVVSRLTGLPVDRKSLQRKTHTQMHRAGMDKKAREKTVENAFAVARPKMIDGSNILLTDDVFTSGATASACAKILKSQGARSIIVFTLAHAEFRRN